MRFGSFAVLAALMGAVTLSSSRAGLAPTRAVEADTALILAVDVSNSVDAERYRLQMEGIARALEDPGVINAISSGPNGGILLTLVEWADGADQTIPWQIVRTLEDGQRFAALVRGLKQKTGEYTCVAHMMGLVKDRIFSDMPGGAVRTVLDVSGDGIDNCRPFQETISRRDALVAEGVQINGLPIIVSGENEIVARAPIAPPALDSTSRLGLARRRRRSMHGTASMWSAGLRGFSSARMDLRTLGVLSSRSSFPK